MGYSSEDLGLFEPLLDPSAREGTAYFELHPKELPEPYACWLAGSLLLQDAAFDFFAGCFRAAYPSFDYFSFQRFGREEISALCLEMASYIAQLGPDVSRDPLFSRYESIFSRDIWAEVPTTPLAAAIKACGEQTLSFITANTKESGCLWVLGM